MRHRRRLFAALAVPVAAVMAAGLAVSGAAHASTGPAAWTAKGAGATPNSASGWRAESSDYYMTHAESYVGGDGNATIGRLPVVAAPVANVVGAPVPSAAGGVGIALCSSSTGISAQGGVVNLGNGFEDVLAGSGQFKSAATNNSDNDPCFDGLADNPVVSTPFAPARVLLANVPVNT